MEPITQLEHQLETIETKIPLAHLVHLPTSNASVGWQIEHILLVINQIIKELSREKETPYQWKFNVKKLIIFITKKVPRGKAKAPKQVLPTTYTVETLFSHLNQTKNTLSSFKNLSKKLYFKHPYFGHLKTKETATFLSIHTNHHLKIIEDIVKEVNG